MHTKWVWALALVTLSGGLVAGCGVSTTLDVDGGGGGVDGGGGGELDAGGGGGAVDAAGGGEVDAGGGGGVDAGPPEVCASPGSVESLPCGMCGTVQRFCTAEGRWAYGTCMGETGVCMPGTTGSDSCGMCGSRASRCTAACTWEAVGECTGEGACAPGTRTRSSAGCAVAGQTRELLCTDACAYEPASECAADGCPTPGTLERVACGMCGTRERFCNASRVWEYGACGGEGVCMPGTTGTEACGMCGSQATRCTDSCTWVSFGACGGEGSCAPGATTRTSAGCPAGQTQVLRCGAACGYTEVVTACTASRPIDVTLVLDSTGSNASSLSADLSTLQTRCIAPLLGLTDVQVGIAYSGEFPVSPYGLSTDRPFEGGIEPTSSYTAVTAELATRPTFNGNDAQDSLVEALSMLTGGPAAMSSIPLSCSPGRVAGGCWRSGARQVVVFHTDSPIHNGPDPASTGLLAPYSGITPTPATWNDVRSRMASSGTLLTFIDTGSTAPAPAQFDEMLRDLGQPLSDHHDADGPTAVGTACDAIVARVRGIAGL